jgi:hypothetical protein
MSAPHLSALEDALTRRGWRIVALLSGDDSRVSATWELKRGKNETLLIDFDGLGADGDFCLPLAESYACHVRGDESRGLYFRRLNRSRKLWEKELAHFIQSLDTLGVWDRYKTSIAESAA